MEVFLKACCVLEGYVNRKLVKHSVPVERAVLIVVSCRCLEPG